MKTLTPQEAAGVLNVTTETLRRWRVADMGPPFVMQGGRPRYRADLLKAGDYAVTGRQATFPAPKVAYTDASRLSEPEQAVLEALMAKSETKEFEPGESLVFVSTGGTLDTSDPVVAALMREMVAKAVGRDG